jgi:hypothetical protein
MFEFIRMMRKSTMALSVFLLFTGVASAQQPESSGAKKIDTCALLTKAEILEAIGKNVQDGKLNPNANPAVGAPCEFVVEDYGAFSLLVKPVGPGETADRYIIITLMVPGATEITQKAAAEKLMWKVLPRL